MVIRRLDLGRVFGLVLLFWILLRLNFVACMDVLFLDEVGG